MHKIIENFTFINKSLEDNGMTLEIMILSYYSSLDQFINLIPTLGKEPNPIIFTILPKVLRIGLSISSVQLSIKINIIYPLEFK
jgi:hypothetical protein